MRSPAAQVLETALALQRAPSERFRLRERPLPSGLIYVLEVASGSLHALAAAAAELDESEPDLLAASRFYLEQVLFAAPDATAYRILGVPHDASPDLIRTHHRWLQRWLHPDRAQAGDASVYATRVNQAWATLRSPELRHQYDIKLAEARMASASAPLAAATLRHWENQDVAPTHGRRARWLLGTALVACAVLAVLIIRHEQSPEPWTSSEAEVADVVGEAPSGQPAIDDRDLGILTEALAVATALPEPLPVRAAHVAIDLPSPIPVAAGTSEIPARVGAAQAATLSLQTTKITARAARTGLYFESDTRTRRIPDPLPVEAAQAAKPQPQEVVNSAAIPVAASAARTREVVTHPEPPTVLLERMAKAEVRVAQVTAYLAAQPGAAPLWNDLKAAQDAERIRNRIAASQSTTLELATPNWQLQRDHATVSVDYRCGKCRVRQGRLDVQLVWRDGLWLVRGIGLVPVA